jgi:hypothetical protein
VTGPTDHDFSRAADLLMIVRIACAAGGVICLVLLMIFGDQIADLIGG